jgi:polyphosphate kinase
VTATRVRRPAAPATPPPYLNRELSWIEFNARVLAEARDRRNPLLERVRFLAIVASNIDEFFQIRIAGLRQQLVAGAANRSADGRSPADQLAAARERLLALVREQGDAWADLRRGLADEGIGVVTYADVPKLHRELRQRYLDEIHPVLTPLSLDPGHPFPYISTLSLSIAVRLRDPETGASRLARVKVPPVLPRLLELPPDPVAAPGSQRFVLIDQVIEANLDTLFSGMEVLEHHLFRVTRNADFAIEEDEADDLLQVIEAEVRRRRFGAAVRLEVERSMPPTTRLLLEQGMGLTADDVYEVRGMLDVTSLDQLLELDRPDLKLPPWTPVTPRRLASPDDRPPDVFAAIRESDVLVHHPYESFGASVERFIDQAADDPEVLTIKLTLYRTSGDSPIIQALIRAAEQGKQVVALVEIKATFDEQANISWARKLEQAGAHVVHGLAGLKVHSKTALVIRREGGVLRRYVHIGTGNYNPKTARAYVDLGLLTCRQAIGQDVTDFFNILTGLSRQRSFRRLLIAPLTLRTRFLELVDREVGHARAGRPSGIRLKMNALVDRPCIDALYRASTSGVPVELIVRGACALLPGVEGRSEQIHVRSIVGEFLEHSRIWRFENGGDPEWYIGSADLMERNLDRRIEVMVPVQEPAAQRRLDQVLDVMLADDRRSWQLGPDACWRRTEELAGVDGTIDTFAMLKALALVEAETGTATGAPARPATVESSRDSIESWA